MFLRRMIVERVTSPECSPGGVLLDVYFYLLAHGAKPDEAVGAIESFVDEAIALKIERQCIELTT